MKSIESQLSNKTPSWDDIRNEIKQDLYWILEAHLNWELDIGGLNSLFIFTIIELNNEK